MLTYFGCVDGRIERRGGVRPEDLRDESGALLIWFERKGWI